MLRATSIFWKHFLSRNCSVEKDTQGTRLRVFQRLICSVMCKQSWGAHVCKLSKSTACCSVLHLGRPESYYYILLQLGYQLLEVAVGSYLSVKTHWGTWGRRKEYSSKSIHERRHSSWIPSDLVHTSTLNYIFNPFLSNQSKWQRHQGDEILNISINIFSALL